MIESTTHPVSSGASPLSHATPAMGVLNLVLAASGMASTNFELCGWLQTQ